MRYPFPVSLSLPTQENKRQTLYLLLEEVEAGQLVTILSPFFWTHNQITVPSLPCSRWGHVPEHGQTEDEQK